MNRWDSGGALRGGVSFRSCGSGRSANYAHASKLEEMTGAGMRFFRHYHAGAEFYRGYLATDGAALHDVPKSWHEAQSCAAVNRHGSLDQEATRN